MNITLKLLPLLGYLCFTITQISAYELATHAKMINFAYGKSQFGSSDLAIQKRLGIDAWVLDSINSKAPFRAGSSDFYYDIALGQVAVRQSKNYEFDVMFKIGLKDEELTVRGWLMRGGVREDDGGLIAGGSKNEPLDDPISNFNRFCNHFLDPISTHGSTGRGFSGFCFFESPISDAAQWALGSQNPFDTQPAENTSRRNHFSVLDARDLMWRALTLRDKAGSDVPKNGFTPEQLRKIYWASTFRSLGDVVHLLQDQAQPQHTRNEGHGYSNKGYEEYINARATQAKQFTIDEQKLTSLAGQLPDLNYDGYPIPRFSRYSDYWSTQINGANKFGMSDYSNRGFFTVEKNFGNTVYPEPSSNLGDYTTSAILQTPGGASFRYLVGKVEDKVTGANDSITMSTQSIFSEMGLAGPIPTIRKYTLSKKNYDDRAALLIPRAVAYSAGLIDYFFRGQMEVNLPAEGIYAIIDHADPLSNCKDDCGFTKIKAKVKNSTPPIVESGTNTTYPQDMTGGVMVAVAKFHRNTCYLPDLSGEYVQEILPPEFGSSQLAGSQPVTTTDQWQKCRSATEEIVTSAPISVANLSAGSENTFSFNFDQPVPINAADLYLQIVYRGKLGAENDAVAVQTIDISEPNYAVFSELGGAVKLGETYTVSCSTVRDTWCRAAFITGLDNYRGNFERCNVGNPSLRPRVSQMDVTTGVHTNMGTFRNYHRKGMYLIIVSGRFQTTDCIDGADILTSVVTPGFAGGANSTSGSVSSVEIHLPPTRIPALNF